MRNSFMFIIIAAVLDVALYAGLLHYGYNKTAFALGLIQFLTVAAATYRGVRI